MVSDELPSILAQWHCPSHSTKSTNVCAHSAKMAIAFTCVGNVIADELNGIKHVMQYLAEDLSMQELCNLCIEDLMLKLSSPGFGGTPRFWSLLLQLAQTDEQQGQNTRKSPDLVCTIIFQHKLSLYHYIGHFIHYLSDHVVMLPSSQPFCKNDHSLSLLTRCTSKEH